MEYLNLQEWDATKEKDIVLPTASKRMGKEVGVRIRILQAVDVLAAMPEYGPDSPELQTLPVEKKRENAAEWIQWGNTVIAKAVVQPPMTPQDADGLGPDRRFLFEEILAFTGVKGDRNLPFRAPGAADGGAAREAVGQAPDGDPAPPGAGVSG